MNPIPPSQEREMQALILQGKLNTKEIAQKVGVSPITVSVAKAILTDKWTEIIMRAISAKVAKRWRFISFRGKKKREWRGVVDVVAIRKNSSDPKRVPLKRGDLFEMLLIQMKGGSAKKVTPGDKRRLQAIKEHYKAVGLIKNVVLFEWVKREKSKFSILGDDLEWHFCKPGKLFV